MDINLRDAAKDIAISTNDGGQYLKLTCQVCAAESYVKLPASLADLFDKVDTHPRHD